MQTLQEKELLQQEQGALLPKMSRPNQHNDNNNDNNNNINNDNNHHYDHNSFSGASIFNSRPISAEEMQEPGVQEEEQGLLQGCTGQVQEQDVQGGQPQEVRGGHNGQSLAGKALQEQEVLGE